MNLESWAMIITTVLSVAAGVFGLGKYIQSFTNAVKESMDVGNALSQTSILLDKILANNIVTGEELKQLKNEVGQVKVEIDQAKTAWKNLFKKK